MREILFRGKRKDSGEWVEGRLLAADVIVPSGQEFSLEANCIYGCDKPIIGYEVDEETVGQFTGLTDKNGKNIFEGDIVKDEFGRIMEVVWREGVAKFSFKLIKSTGKKWTENFLYVNLGDWFDLENHFPEAIGNIHDNHELLEGAEK